VARRRGDYARAIALYEHELEVDRNHGDKAGIAATLHNLGIATYHAGDAHRAAALFEESLAMSQELGDRGVSANTQIHLGEMATVTGDFERAAVLYGKSLPVLWELRNMDAFCDGLRMKTRLAAAVGHDVAQAARLLGVEEGLRQSIGLAVPRSERQEYEDLVARVREALGEPAFAAAWAAGQAMSVEQAIDEVITIEACP
jgi:tetratricopeptide (TPR) repeat protein